METRERIQALAASLVIAPRSLDIAALSEIENAIAARGFAGLSQRLRTLYGAPAWSGLKAEQIHRGVPQVALRFLSAHADGRIREACVRAFDESPENLRWLLLRCNDWHLPLAVLATMRVINSLDAGNASYWLPYLTLVQGYGRGYRGDGPVTPVLAAMAAVAREHPEAFETFLREPASPPEPARQALAMLETSHPERAQRAAASSPDTVLRARALRKTDDPEHWRQVMHDPVPSLRAEAQQKLWEAGLGDRSLLRLGLLDPAASVRESAKFLGRKAGLQPDIEEIYRQAPGGVGALEGAVGVLPPEELEPILRAHFEAPRARLRKAAMLAFDRLRPGPAEELWWALANGHADPLQRAFARKLLRARRSSLLSGERLWQALFQAGPQIARELQDLAEHSPCPYTRLRAHLYSLLRWPERWPGETFGSRLRQLSYQLPPYKMPAERKAILASLIAQLPEARQPELALWLEKL